MTLTQTCLGVEHFGSADTRLKSLETLYDAYHRQALGLAFRMLRNQLDAEEVVQEAFLSVWRTGTTFDATRGSARTWVLTAVRNRAIDMIRARKRRPLPDSLDVEVHDSECDVAESAATSVDREWMLCVLASLPPMQRNAVELAYCGGFSHTEIAGLLNLPVGTVKGRIRLGLDHLRRAMAGDRDVDTGGRVVWVRP